MTRYVHAQKSKRKRVYGVGGIATCTVRSDCQACGEFTRYLIPECHPGTRQNMTTRIKSWLTDKCRDESIIWLHGFPGVGKSTIAWTIAEHCIETGQLGAALFFGRTSHIDSADLIVAMLVHQLAECNHDYAQTVSQQRIAGGQNFEQLRAQFEKEITGPFTTLRDKIQQPMLIILDGLDECFGLGFAVQFIELIHEFDRSPARGTLLWMLSTHTEAYHIYTHTRHDIAACHREEEILQDAEETREEIALFLRDGFRNVRKQFPENVPASEDESWPSDEELGEIVSATCGLFEVASTALRFIGDANYANPKTRFDLLMGFVRTYHHIATGNPVYTLDRLYTLILSEIPTDLLPTTLMLLGLISLNPEFIYTCGELANFLGLDSDTFYSALRPLHCVLGIPEPSRAFDERLQPLHSLFLAYLQNPLRSGRFFPFTTDFWRSIVHRTVRWTITCLDFQRHKREYDESTWWSIQLM